MSQLVRANSPKVPACSVKAIASTNDSLVEDEIARLKDKDVLARQQDEEILGFLFVVTSLV